MNIEMLKRINLILVICTMSSCCLSSTTKEESMESTQQSVTIPMNNVSDYFDVQIGRQKLSIQLPENLRNYLMSVISDTHRKPPSVQGPSIAKVLCGTFVLQNKEFGWYGGSEIISLETGTAFHLLPFFGLGDNETKRDFPELVQFFFHGASSNRQVGNGHEIKRAYTRFIMYLNGRIKNQR